MKASMLVAVLASVLPLVAVVNAQDTVEDILLPEALWALCSGGGVTVTPNACDEACVADLVESEGGIEFRPSYGAAPDVGLVYLPGGRVDPRAYSVFARKIASKGYFTAIIPFPDNITFFEPLRPSTLISAHPEIRAWAVVGHSLGSVTAADYASMDPLGKVDALGLFAGYPLGESDLSQTNLPVLEILASEDGVINVTQYEEGQSLLPLATTRQVVIEGGNHEGFGYYVRDDGFDGVATIPRWQQHHIAVRETIDLLKNL